MSEDVLWSCGGPDPRLALFAKGLCMWDPARAPAGAAGLGLGYALGQSLARYLGPITAC